MSNAGTPLPVRRGRQEETVPQHRAAYSQCVEVLDFVDDVVIQREHAQLREVLQIVNFVYCLERQPQRLHLHQRGGETLRRARVRGGEQRDTGPTERVQETNSEKRRRPAPRTSLNSTSSPNLSAGSSSSFCILRRHLITNDSSMTTIFSPPSLLMMLGGQPAEGEPRGPDQPAAYGP